MQTSLLIKKLRTRVRGGSRTAATSKMERFVIIVNGLQPLTIITKRSILDVAAALDPPLRVMVSDTNNMDNLNLVDKSSCKKKMKITKKKLYAHFQICNVMVYVRKEKEDQ